MKLFYLLFYLFIFNFVISQSHSVGMNNGVIWTNVIRGGDSKFIAGYTGQINYEFRTKFDMGFSAGVGYDQKGYMEKETFTSPTNVSTKVKYKYHLNYLTIPIECKYYLEHNGIDYFYLNFSYIPGFLVSPTSNTPILNNEFEGYQKSKHLRNHLMDHAIKVEMGFYSYRLYLASRRAVLDCYLTVFFTYSFNSFDLDYDRKYLTLLNQYSIGLNLVTQLRFGKKRKQ